MVMMAVSAVDSVSLAHLLTEDPSRCLLLDCRSFFAFSASHVSGALNVRFCSIVRRRAKGAMGLEHVVPHEESRSRLLASHYTLVVVYDERTVEFESLKKDSTALLAANALCREQYGATIAYLRGEEEQLECECVCGTVDSLRFTVLALKLGDFTQSLKLCCGRSLEDVGGPVEILPFLYLGSAFHASRRDMLDALGITALINVSATCPNHFEGHYLYKCIPVEDSHKADISCWFKEAIHFVDSVKNAGGRVFVHCQAGISRSATICLAYLMSSNRVRLDEAFEFVKQRRSVISPNFSFMGQLLQFEAQVLTPSCSAEAASPLKKPSGASSTQFVFNFPVSMPVCSAANSLGFLQPITASPTY
uniref:Dual specificity protein phosphatase n=1 Tax=Callorhinchus milii TaxID=7868 RepID=A0A4W3GY38_CALMI